MNIFPKKIDFFSILQEAAVNVTKATTTLVDIFEHYNDVEAKVKEMYEIEQEGDILTHDIIRKLNQTFITPIDREDIQALACNIDDIVDLIWGGVDKMVVFQIEDPTRDAVQLALDLNLTAEAIVKAIKDLRAKDYERVKEHCIEINRLENMIDRGFRNALGELFDDFKDDPLMVIKWKEIYEHLENSADKCEDVANILEGIVLKHA
jgi:predicted phosphate transport protein (TIGR00153 family)